MRTFQKAIKNLWYIFKVRHLLPISVLISLYTSLFSSFLQYGVTVWGLTHEVHTRPIYLLQKKVVRAIAFKSFSSPSTPIFSDLKILKLNDLFELKLLTFAHESVNMVFPVLYHNIFATFRRKLKLHLFSTRYQQ